MLDIFLGVSTRRRAPTPPHFQIVYLKRRENSCISAKNETFSEFGGRKYGRGRPVLGISERCGWFYPTDWSRFELIGLMPAGQGLMSKLRLSPSIFEPCASARAVIMRSAKAAFNRDVLSHQPGHPKFHQASVFENFLGQSRKSSDGNGNWAECRLQLRRWAR